MLEQGGAVFGAALDEGMTARHVCARTVEELAPMRGSKYVQSDLGGSFSQVKALLEEGTAVLFSGVPCQVDGLKRYLGKDYPNLLTCDLVCHGVPSPAVFRAYLDGLEAAHGSKVVSVRFKDKSHGWSHPWFTAQFADGSVYTEDFNRTGYGRGFGMQLFLRPACARCRYTSTSRPADFTLADYWGLDEKLALPVERDKGVSMVLVNSARGQVVFDALSPRFGQMERPLAEAVAHELERQLAALPRAEIARASLEANGKLIVCRDLREGIAVANRIAPEHLELCVDNPFDYLGEIQNAGSVFLGRYNPEPMGDYFAGPNHTLPTMGTARFYSPLSVDDFVKKSQFSYYTRDALARDYRKVSLFARKEGLDAHARAVDIRFEGGEA